MEENELFELYKLKENLWTLVEKRVLQQYSDSSQINTFGGGNEGGKGWRIKIPPVLYSVSISGDYPWGKSTHVWVEANSEFKEPLSALGDEKIRSLYEQITLALKKKYDLKRFGDWQDFVPNFGIKVYSDDEKEIEKIPMVFGAIDEYVKIITSPENQEAFKKIEDYRRQIKQIQSTLDKDREQLTNLLVK